MSRISRYRVAHQALLSNRTSGVVLSRVSRDRTWAFVGRPGLDPGTLGSKGTFHRLFSVGLVAHVHSFQGTVLF